VESHEIWDTTNPSSPVLLKTIDSGATNTHKDWWECYSGVAYLVGNDGTASAGSPDSAPGWQQSGSTQHIKIYNLHDPANPEYIRDFGFVGQQPTATPPAIEGLVTPPTGIHGPISAGDRIYAAYGVGGNGAIQILDRSKVLNGCTAPGASANCAKSPTQSEMLAPQLGSFTLPGTSLQGGHTSFPIYGEQDGKPRNLILVTSADGQYDVRELNHLLEAIEQGADLVLGYRPKRADSIAQRLDGWGWNMLINLVFGPTARDVDCAFKLFRQNVWQRVGMRSRGMATFYTELLVRARRLGFRVVEVPVKHHRSAEALPRGGASPAAIWHALADLKGVRRRMGEVQSARTPPAGAAISIRGRAA